MLNFEIIKDVNPYSGTFFQSILVCFVNINGAAYQKLCVDDKILSFDDTDYSLMDVNEAYHNACNRIGTVKNITVSRKQTL